MNVNDLRFSDHAIARIRERITDTTDVGHYINFIRKHQSHTLSIFNGGKMSKADQVKYKHLKNDIHLLAFYNNDFHIIVVNRHNHFVITVMKLNDFYVRQHQYVTPIEVNIKLLLSQIK